MASSTSNRLLGLILIVALLGAGGRTLWLWLDTPIERVSIRGDLNHVSARYLQQRLTPLIQGQTWLSVDLDRMRQGARAIPWIRDAKVTRRWPDALTFELYEQRPVAWWNDDSLLNSEGEPFRAGPIKQVGELPNLAGPQGSGPEVLAWLDQLRQKLAPLDVRVTQLRLEARGAWRFQLNDSFWVMVGRTNSDDRLKRFMTAWQRGLSERAGDLRYLDLRYPNGLAVAWHGQSAPVEDGDNSEQ
ncbi:cell division protein FtsQ [Kushneria sinocarnis]|uniref:Cell division protein FtsQ n=1 Tax=Kushneria sinocarnis TaxID=595502 RepID=A0A420WVB3_9GAMM|nr:cell division protein FtsQ/DivIB [Kushneria sinocarnis]RKR02493.1 cell division protein FtsQ [Kushneria sinocarnis]